MSSGRVARVAAFADWATKVTEESRVDTQTRPRRATRRAPLSDGDRSTSERPVSFTSPSVNRNTTSVVSWPYRTSGP